MIEVDTTGNTEEEAMDVVTVGESMMSMASTSVLHSDNVNTPTLEQFSKGICPFQVIEGERFPMLT